MFQTVGHLKIRQVLRARGIKNAYSEIVMAKATTQTNTRKQNKPKGKDLTPKTTSRKATTKSSTTTSKVNLNDQINKAVQEAKSRAGRHPLDTTVFFKILDELAKPDPDTGRTRTLSDVLKLDGMPSRATFYRWLDADQTGLLRKEYSFICMVNYDNMHDERLRVAYDASTDIVMKEMANGELVPDVNIFSVPRSKEIIRTLEWTLSRLAANKYGDNIKIDANIDASPESLETLFKMGEEKRRQAEQNAAEHAALMREKMQAFSEDQ